MSESYGRERVLRKIGSGHHAPHFDGKMSHDGTGFKLDGVIEYGPREKEHFRGDLKDFERKMRTKGLIWDR